MDKIELTISDIANLLNGNTMCIEYTEGITHLEISFKEERENV